MLNTTTLAKVYIDFCKQGGSMSFKPSADGFVRMVTDPSGIIAAIFFAYVVSQGYDMKQVEQWETDTFIEGIPDQFFEDLEAVFKEV